MGLLKLQVIGNLGQDAVVNSVSGKTVINFSVAFTEKWKDAQGVERNKTVWTSCAYWSERTAVAQYLKKGMLVYCEGQADIGTYTNGRNQVEAQLKLRVSQIQLLGSKNENTGGNAAQNSVNQQSGGYNPDEITEPRSDLPF